MPNCELCGRSEILTKAIIESSLLNVCENCAKFGKPILVKQHAAAKPLKQKTTEIINIINPDYPGIIKNAREKLEKILNIKLIEVYQETNEKLNLKDSTLTIGDLVNLKN